jgi:hypothetical protein
MVGGTKTPGWSPSCTLVSSPVCLQTLAHQGVSCMSLKILSRDTYLEGCCSIRLSYGRIRLLSSRASSVGNQQP